MDAPPNSRIIVKNIPFSETEKSLVKEFSKKGELTDCRIIRRKDGKSRGFAYIGYKTVEEATNALKYFNNTYIGSLKITVNYALPIGTEELEETRARKKKQEKEKRKEEQKIEKTKKELKKKGIEETDPKWQEFLAAQVKHNERMSWNDGVGFVEQYAQPKQENENNEEEEKEEEEEEKNENTKKEERLTTNTTRLYVKNIPYKSTAEEVKAEFEKYGEVVDVHLQAGAPGENAGACYVKFATLEAATDALNTPIIMMGRHLKLQASEPEPERKKPVIQDDDMSFKDKKAARLRQHTPENYNPFFMNKDTIAEAIAARIGVTRADVLNPESEDAASRLAVAESQLVEETKQLFAANGIDPEIITRTTNKNELSRTVLFVKNLRYETTEEELRGMFAAKGTLVRFVLAPTHSIAIVEFARPDEARKAWESLNYRLLHDSPLFIQWAPEGCTTGPGSETDERKSRIPKVEIKTTTLIVKNLPFEAKKADVRNVCSTYGKIKAIRMSKKPDGSGHRGFCFLDFATRQEAQSAYDSLQNVHLLGRHLIVQPAQEGKNEETKSQKQGSLGEIITKTKKRESKDEFVDEEPPKAEAK